MLSQHPADQLVRDLVAGWREPAAGDKGTIVGRVASVPFNVAEVRVAPAHRGLIYRGEALGERADSLTYHVAQRVLVDRQWSEETTADQFLDDLRAAARHPEARLAAFVRRGGHIVTALAPTEDVVPTQRRGALALSVLAVVFSADRGMIITGYQASSPERISIPENAIWLD
jgi:hypothetical protein